MNQEIWLRRLKYPWHRNPKFEPRVGLLPTLLCLGPDNSPLCTTAFEGRVCKYSSLYPSYPLVQTWNLHGRELHCISE